MAASKFLNLDTDGTLVTNSDEIVPSQKAIKTYVDTKTRDCYTSNNLVAGTDISLVIHGVGNYETIGTVTVVDNIASGFSDANYLRASTQIDIASGNTWEIKTAVKQTDSYGPILSTFTYASTGWILETQSNGKIKFGRHNGTINLFSNTNTVQANTKIYIDVKFTGTEYTLSHSYDKVTWVVDQTIVEDKLSFGGEKIHIGKGLVYGGYFGGEVDLAETVVYIDGEVAWSAISTDSYTAINNTLQPDTKSTSKNASNQLQTIGIINQNNTANATKEWIGTKAEYDAILSKDANTKYIVTDDVADNCIVIDTELSSTSTNPVQNRAIYAVIGDIETLINAL